MGYSNGADCFLYAEEALFLVDNNLANVYYKGNLLLLPHLYWILSNAAKISVFCYTVYSQMLKAGYILRKYKVETDIEKLCVIC